jgi:hypothetical protein
MKAGAVGAEALSPLRRTELVEFRMTVDAAIWVRDVDVSGLLDRAGWRGVGERIKAAAESALA